MKDSIGNAKEGLSYGFGKLGETGHSIASFFDFGGINDATIKIGLVIKLFLLIGAVAYALYHIGRLLNLKRTFKKIITDPVAAWSSKVGRSQSKAYHKTIATTIPVVAVMNDQDGIGKSTITANLAAYFDKAGLNVLVIDYDSKDSLSHILPLKNGHHFSSELILKSDIAKVSSLRAIPEPDALGAGFEHSWLYASGKELRHYEKELEYSWFTGQEKRDIRFNLHNFLSLPEVQEQYHIVLIDAPAGLSAINANILCAATHVLVPTILDTVSINHTIDTLQDYQDYRQKLGLDFKFLGVMASLVSSDMGVGHVVPRDRAAHENLQIRLKARFRNLVNPASRKRESLSVLSNGFYRLVAFIQTDNTKLAYHKGEEPIQSLVTSVGQEVFSKLGFQDNQNLPLKKKKPMTHYRDPDYVVGQKIEKVPVLKKAA